MSRSSAGISDGVWDRVGGSHSLSKNVYVALITAWTAAGLAATAVAAQVSASWQMSWPLLLGTLVVAIAGIITALKSDNPLISLAGYSMVVVAEGVLLGPVLAMYTEASIARVFLVTAGMVTVLGAVGTIYPKSLESWGGWLFGGLLLLIIGMLLVPLASYFGYDVGGALTILDWVGIVLFGAYVIYDLNRAMQLQRTLDNTIDVALAVYLDFINIFIRLLRLYGEKK